MAFARRTIGVDASVPATVENLDARGSDRVFYRFSWGEGRSVVVIDYDPGRTENRYYADIARYLRSMRVPVPEVMGHDPEAHLMVLEDLGSKDLHAFAGEDWPTRRVLYQRTLTAARRLHSIAEKDFPSGSVKLMNGFGPELYLFEQNYFLEHFVRNHCDVVLEPAFESRLMSELSRLTDELCSPRRCLVHRDLQSQNVMVMGSEPYFIDFQGMRFGNAFYDLGSLLCDPYISFTPEEREELLSFYYILSSQELDWDAFQRSFWSASVERLMQALGAYGFLGRTKGLAAFLGHIPAGLHNLSTAASHVTWLSTLRELTAECSVALD
jgi:aminoglycoside/choline kinase family phosphotransferase